MKRFSFWSGVVLFASSMTAPLIAEGTAEALDPFIEPMAFGMARTFFSSSLTEDDSSTALMHAAWKGDMETVKFLLKKGADANAETEAGMTPLGCAIMNLILNDDIKEGEQIVKLIIKKGGKIDSASYGEFGELLIFASYLGKTEAVRFLIKKGFDVNIKDEKGQTPLTAATEAGHKDTVAILKAFGAKE